jgi:phytoene synthase
LTVGDSQASRGTTAPDDGAAEIAAVARAGEPDRYLAALLAPEPQRAALLALAAFAAELARIPHRAVREPYMGEIRLEWWRTALGFSGNGNDGRGSSGHAVADAMRSAVRRYNLPVAALDAMIDAHALELQAAPFRDDAALQAFLDRTEGALFALAARVAGPVAGPTAGPVARLGARPRIEAACAAAGRAYGLARLLLRLPHSLALGRMPLAQTQVAAAGLSAHELIAGTVGETEGEALLRACFAQIRGSLAEARRLVRPLPRRQRVAFLPLALVGPYLRLLERQGGGALREERQMVPLRRVWALAAAHVLGRL